MGIKEYKDATLKLNQFHSDMVDFRIKAKIASFDDIFLYIEKSILDSKIKNICLLGIKTAKLVSECFSK